MKIIRTLSIALTAVLVLFGLANCAKNSGGSTTESSLGGESNYAPQPSNFRFLLTDKPLEDAKQVNVTIKQIELLLEKGGKEARLVFGENLGVINLLDLRNGVKLPVKDLNLPESVTIRQIRMILQEDGHSVVHSDLSLCDMKTPSAQHSGVKIIMKTPVTVEPGYSYSMVVDFDASRSVVVQGNGRCLLKPVLKLQSFERAQQQGQTDGSTGEANNEPTPEPTKTPVTDPVGEPLADGTDSNNLDSNDGYDVPQTEDAPVITTQDLETYF